MPPSKPAAQKAAQAKPAATETPAPVTEPKPAAADPAPADGAEESSESSLSEAAKALALEALQEAEKAQSGTPDDDPLAGTFPDGCEGGEHSPALNPECEEAPADPVKKVEAPAAATLTPPPPAPDPEPEERLTATLVEAAVERSELTPGVTVLRDFRGNRLDPAKVFTEPDDAGNCRALVHVVVHTTETEHNREVRTQLIPVNAVVSLPEALGVIKRIAAGNAAEDTAEASTE
jgi:hypothetical protein